MKKFSYEDLLSGNVDAYQAIEEMYDQIDLTDAQAYEKTMEQFSYPKRLIFAVDCYMAEVYNGGHDQFFFNSTGVMWKDALAGLEAIGAREAATILRRVVAKLECVIPGDADERRAMMDGVKDGFFEEDDGAFYDLEVDLPQLEKAYIQQHANDFI